MSQLTCSISISLDSYVAGPDPGLRASGEQLHEWVFGKDVSIGGGGYWMTLATARRSSNGRAWSSPRAG